MKRWQILAAVLALAVTAALGRDEDDPADARAHEVAALIVEDPAVPAGLFAKSFLDAVPKARIESLLGSIWAESGKVVSVTRTSGDRLSGKFLLDQERGMQLQCTIGVAAEAPHKIVTLFLKPLGPAVHSLADLEKEVARLPGQTSFAVARLTSGSPVLLAGHDEDAPLAIGSAFKLWVLGQLVQDVAKGERRWTDAVPLRAERRSMPSGMLQTWPDRSPVTLHTLASLMISISDNTATDNLVAVLGRERIERHRDAMGAHETARTVPLLMTSDMFRLKWGRRKDAARRYLASDLAGKRAILAALDEDPLPDLAAAATSPTLIGELEWFASASDLVRTMDWLRVATERDRTARGVLSINNGGVEPDGWRWLGFKGGSEPGVLQLCWLAERQDGAWFVVSLGWNDPRSPVELAKLGALASRALAVVGAAHPVKSY